MDRGVWQVYSPEGLKESDMMEVTEHAQAHIIKQERPRE